MFFFGFWYTIFTLFVLAIFLVPTARILQRAGYSGWFALLGLIPMVNLAMLWVFAYAPWPSRPSA